jgi:hypothetical protein
VNTKSGIEIAAASVIGRDHRHADRPCQDAFAIRAGAGGVVAVVADGCGSGAHSELGARLGANLLAAALLARLDALAESASWRAACDEVVARLAALVPALGDDPLAAIADHLLFTLLAAAVTPDGAFVMTIGDGVVIADDRVEVLEADDNAPAYLGYELCGPARPLAITPLPGARAILLATDGARALLEHAGAALPHGRGAVLDLTQVAGDDRMFRHPDALRRRLAVASQPGGVLADDTTVVALRRAL